MTGKDMCGEEKRLYERLPKNTAIIYHHMDELTDGDGGHDAQLFDFSGGGARFLTNELLAKNSQLVLNLEFGGWRNNNNELIWTGENRDIGRLQAIGVVMWCSAADKNGLHEIGIRFVGRVN
ncbi:MAG: PilZ domain-containing protein [Deltaproteobacteria bacterium]|nr:PilZ domain-containing protein [Deltaproteobacteria bacterium]